MTGGRRMAIGLRRSWPKNAKPRQQVAEAERSLELKEWQDYINNLFKD